MSFLKYFRDRGPGEDWALDEARACLQWAQMPHHERFMAYLSAEIEKPVDIEGEASMIRAAVRANTFREIRAKIKRDVSYAAAAVEDHQEDILNA